MAEIQLVASTMGPSLRHETPVTKATEQKTPAAKSTGQLTLFGFGPVTKTVYSGSSVSRKPVARTAVTGPDVHHVFESIQFRCPHGCGKAFFRKSGMATHAKNRSCRVKIAETDGKGNGDADGENGEGDDWEDMADDKDSEEDGDENDDEDDDEDGCKKKPAKKRRKLDGRTAACAPSKT